MADLARYQWGLGVTQCKIAGTITKAANGTTRAFGTLSFRGGGLMEWPFYDYPMFAALPRALYDVRVDPNFSNDPEYPYQAQAHYAYTYVTPNLMSSHGIGSPSPATGVVATAPVVNLGGDAIAPGDDWDVRLVRTRCWILMQVYYPQGGMVVDFDLSWPGGGNVVVARLTKQQLVDLAAAHNFPDPNLAAAVAMAESGGDTGAVHVNDDGSIDKGTWQINSIHGFDPVLLFDQDYNADAAYTVSNGGADWTPWATYNSGAYLAFL